MTQRPQLKLIEGMGIEDLEGVLARAEQALLQAKVMGEGPDVWRDSHGTWAVHALKEAIRHLRSLEMELAVARSDLRIGEWALTDLTDKVIQHMDVCPFTADQFMGEEK